MSEGIPPTKEAQPTEIKIEVAKPEDVRGIEEVFHETWLATYPAIVPGIEAEDIEDHYKDRFLEENLQARAEFLERGEDDHVRYVARMNDKIVGVAFARKNDSRNQLLALYVLPEYQQRGVGRLLWNEVHGFFDTDKNTYVEVAEHNDQAIRFYESVGFVDKGVKGLDTYLKNGKAIGQKELVIPKEIQELD